MSAAVECAAFLPRRKNGAAGDLEWCATKDGQPFDESASNVATLCGYFITLPCGSGKRRPTCSECKVARATAKETL